MIPSTLPEQMADLYNRIAEMERRGRNRRRTGTIKEVDHEKGRYRVELSAPDSKPYLSPWIKARTVGAGTVKMDILYNEGEQVDVVSESGDMADAMIDFSSYSDSNSRENSDTPLHFKIGDTVFQASGSEIRLKATTIILDGEVHLGGEGGQLLHRKGDIDSGGDTAIGSASRVFAV